MDGQKKPGLRELRQGLVGLCCALAALGILGGCSYVSGLNARPPGDGGGVHPAVIGQGDGLKVTVETTGILP